MVNVRLQDMSAKVEQLNRIIEVECSEKIFDDPQLTADTLKKNYGYAGIDFVNVVKEMSIDDIKSLQKHYQGLYRTMIRCRSKAYQ